MCDQHNFQFDVDKAYAHQVLAVFEASPQHPLLDPQAPRLSGVYALYWKGNEVPVYVGDALGTGGVRGRLRDHRRKVEGREGISVEEMACRFIVIDQKWEVAHAESVLIENFNPEWNGIPGFSMHGPGSCRPGMPGYLNEWDKKFPFLT